MTDEVATPVVQTVPVPPNGTVHIYVGGAQQYAPPPPPYNYPPQATERSSERVVRDERVLSRDRDRGGVGAGAIALVALILVLPAALAWSVWGKGFGSVLPAQPVVTVCPVGTFGIYPACIPQAPPAQPVAPPGTCDTKCLEQWFEARCADWAVKYHGPMVEGMTAAALRNLIKETKKCPAIAELPPPPVVYKPPVVKVKVKAPAPAPAYAPMICPDDNCDDKSQVVTTGCSIEVRVRSAGKGYPADQLTAWANGGQIGRKPVRGATAPHDGKVYIPVDCSFAYGVKGQVCFGNDPGLARNLNRRWFKAAQENLARGERVLNKDSNIASLWFADDGT